MTCDDLAAAGVEPVNLSNILDVDRLDERVVDALMRGLHAAAEVAGIAVVGGEIAELGERIGGWGSGMHFNWCATAIGVLPADQEPLDGSAVAPGQAVVALRSRGLRSNGYSLARRLLAQAHGPDWHGVPSGDGRSWGEALLTPSLIYCPLITELRRRGVPLTGVAHITGGGIADNFARVLALRGLGAALDDVFPPQPFVLALQALGGVPEAQAYQLWNMGNGMLFTLPAEAAPEACAIAAAQGYQARIAGAVTAEPTIVLDTRGCQPGRLLHR
jgi:phosphoribosylformylglycinamidine cyclo-ligase